MQEQLKNIEIYNQYASEYATKFMNFGLYNDTFDALLNLLSEEASILELGCGPGNVIQYFSKKKPNLKITGIDLAPEMLRLAKELNPHATFQMLDIKKVGSIESKYDAIVAAFCLPYLAYADLTLFFQNLNHLTTPQGLIYVSCMEGEKEKSSFEKTSFTGDSDLYIWYHQRENLESLIKQNGFEVVRLYTKDYPETDGSVTVDLVYIARKL